MANDSKSHLNSVTSTFKSALIFKMVEGFKYTVKISHTKTTAVNIMKNLEPGGHAKRWLLRFDNPHKKVHFPHLNISHRHTGMRDPHIKLPPGTLTVAQGGAYVGKALDCLCYLTIIIDGIQLGQAIYKDHKNGTMENTVECTVDKTGQYAGGIVGALVGKSIGALILPGVGPLIGAFALGCLGVAYGQSSGKELYSKSANYYQHYWSERKLKQLREMEMNRFLYISQLQVNPFCD